MKIIICGKSGSGKDLLRRRMEYSNFSYGKPYTTRPKRAGESDLDYAFIEKDHFLKLVEKDFFFHYNTYNDWYYGIPFCEWNSSNLFIMSPEAIRNINEKELRNCFIIYLDIEESIRKSRIESRVGNSDSVERRIKADNQDFENFQTYNLRITNSDF